jgi:hypothetical protein
MRKISAKWVPKYLNADQKRNRVLASQVILDQFGRDPVGFFNCLVTMDETWTHIYDPETNEQSKENRRSGFPHPKKFKTQKSSSKVLESLLGQRWYFACRTGNGCNRHGKVLHYTYQQTEAGTGLQTLRQAFKKNLVFFKTILLLTRQLLHTRNWQILLGFSQTPGILT